MSIKILSQAIEIKKFQYNRNRNCISMIGHWILENIQIVSKLIIGLMKCYLGSQ